MRSLHLSLTLMTFLFAMIDLHELPRKFELFGTLNGRLKRSVETTPQPHVTVHHYHYYYYCCPDMAARVKSDPRLAQALHNASCSFDKSSVRCEVPSSQQHQQHQQQQQHHPQQQQQHQQQHPQQQQHHPQQQQQHQQQHPQQQQQQQHTQQQQQHAQQQQQQQQQQHTQQQQQHAQQQHPQQQQQHPQQQKTQTMKPYRADPFYIDRLFNDPFGKQFFDFVTDNFVRRDSERELDECLTSAFDDPICTDFFNFFNQNFMRKPEKHVAQTNHSTPVPLHASQPGNTQQPHQFKDLEHFRKVDSMFNELENNMKKAFSKTSDLGKMLGVRFDDFR
ncbi:alpha-protein kinase 1-like [Macrosteles quadrilineatus]|uniref:alpha-protein kinase 1-like n=1 Tax=Macrosteles quadrilineatus TaxID=74068 RepID=UPI0023E20F0B|nr:alpha-protein kinase 1-like [Macrosteles quadrilineatus]